MQQKQKRNTYNKNSGYFLIFTGKTNVMYLSSLIWLRADFFIFNVTISPSICRIALESDRIREIRSKDDEEVTDGSKPDDPIGESDTKKPNSTV